MQLRQATRQKAKLRLGLSAVSGGGKTLSALLIAYGITGDWTKIAVIDTENNSADLYAHLGAYNVLSIAPPFSPERYTEAIKTCESSGMELIIVDSITHEWEGEGGILYLVDQIGGGFNSAWKTLTPRHEKFKQAILQSKCHMITTVRRKTEYAMQDSTNRQGNTVKAPVKVGLKEVTREGWEYEVTLNLEIDVKHLATSSKDRTGLFANADPFTPTVETGKLLRDWCESGAEPLPVQDNREEFNPSHPNWSIGIDALKNKGYTIEQVKEKYKLTSEVEAKLKQIISDKPQPVTQSQISENLKTETIPTPPVLNGQTKKPF